MDGNETEAGAERGDGARGYRVSVTRGERRLVGIGLIRALAVRCIAILVTGGGGGDAKVEAKKGMALAVATVGEGEAVGESTCIA